MRLVRVAAAVLAGAVVLTGCSDGGTANETLPSTSTTAAEMSEPLQPLGPPDLPMPAEAREQTPAGAEAFLRYYMDIYSWSQAHMDSSYMDQFSQGCELCDSVTKTLRDDATAGYSYEGGQITVSGSSFGLADNGRIEGSFSIAQSSLVVRGSDGAEFPELGAAPE